jgi:L-fucose mutarotase
MLKGIDPLLTPDLLRLLAQAGHGDMIAVVDRNFPAYSQGAPTIDLPGVDVTQALRAIAALLPIDVDFLDTPVQHMLTVGGEPGPAVDDVHAVLVAAEGREVAMEGLERFAFYAAAKRAFVIVRTSDQRPYADFLVAKGVI